MTKSFPKAASDADAVSLPGAKADDNKVGTQLLTITQLGIKFQCSGGTEHVTWFTTEYSPYGLRLS